MSLNKAEKYFRENLSNIVYHGSVDENPRTLYKSDNEPAHSKYITQVFEQYNIGLGELPITEARRIPIKNAIKEIQWIYQDQTSDLSVLEDKYGIMWWRDWEVGNGTIGQRYGATVKKHELIHGLLEGLTKDPYGRRHIINLWQASDFAESDGLLPCAFMTNFSVRNVNGVMYLDMTLYQRSSDYLVAGHINKMQYVAFMMMVAKHCGYIPGKFSHFVQNLHIYDRHEDQALEILGRLDYIKQDSFIEHQPVFSLEVPNNTNFFEINYTDFKLNNYNPLGQLKFDLGI